MFNKKTVIKFEDFRSVIGSCIAFLKEETCAKLNEHSDVFTDKYKKMFDVAVIPSALMFTEDELLHVPRKDKDGNKVKWEDVTYSKKEIASIYNKGIPERMRTPAKAHMEYAFNDQGLLEIKGLYITINLDILKTEILTNLYDINRFIDITLKGWVHHECGHILDYILSYEGKKRSVVDKLNKEDSKARKEYNAWIKSVMPKGSKFLPPELDRQRINMYFTIPCEARADTLGGVDRNKIIDYMFEDDKYRIIATIKSKTVKREPVPAAEDKPNQDK